MTVAQPKTVKSLPDNLDPVVNDFSITVGTVNGSGSQTSNLTLLRALFKMGIPVSGKNMFPSNIQGLPTWYTIRVNADGFIARRDEHEIVVAMNKDSFVQDLAKVVPGGAFFYADHLKFAIDRDDVAIYPIPAKTLAKESDAVPALRDYVANMAYVGVLADMLGIDMEKVRLALDFHFGGREKPIALNMSVIEAAAAWAADNLEKQDPYLVQSLDKTDGLIMADGNTAAGLGAIYGGVQFVSWYPITPASSVAESLEHHIANLRKDADTGKNNYAIVQAEDELAAIGMAVGAGWSGLRSMTSTSGPGISLMTEFAGMAYFAEIPVVIWNVQRVGPSTGLPTRTAQADLTMTYFLGHGDTQNIILLPGTVNECFEFGWRAFDLAERIQSPIFVLSDLDMGMNQWMADPFEYPDKPMDRGKVLWEADLEKREGKWARYLDEDGDAIPYRTVPGNKHPASAYFTRGTGHDEYARYSEDGPTYEKLMARLKRKYDHARDLKPKPVVETMEGAKFGIIAFGSTDSAIQEARVDLEKKGFPSDYMRIRAVPFNQVEQDFITSHERIYVVEMNRDGQMHQLLTLDMPEHNSRLVSLTHHDGLSLTAKLVCEKILAEEQN